MADSRGWRQRLREEDVSVVVVCVGVGVAFVLLVGMRACMISQDQGFARRLCFGSKRLMGGW